MNSRRRRGRYLDCTSADHVRERGSSHAEITTSLWFDDQALDAAADAVKRGIHAMYSMKKLDLAALQAAYDGK
jgi:hypothetical protein